MTDLHGIRRITDEHGIAWEVWEAHPRLVERRRLRERRATSRRDGERRESTNDTRPAAAGDAGWLVFRSSREERRRTPIPPHWETMDAEQLAEVLRRSRATGPVQRARAGSSQGSPMSGQDRFPSRSGPAT